MPKKNNNVLIDWLLVIHAVPHLYAVLIACCAIYLMIVLGTYNPQDPSWFYFSTQALPPTNKGGVIGAQVAALLFFLFGSASLFLVPLLGFIVYLLVSKKKLLFEWDRLLGGVLFLFVCTILSSFYGSDPLYSIVPGGYVGSTFFGWLQAAFGRPVTAIFLHTILLISLLLLTRLSGIVVVQAVFRFIRFYTTKEYLVFACKKLYQFLCILSVPFQWLWQQTCTLFAGQDILNSGQSIVEFETIVIDEFHNHKEEFWQQSNNEPVVNNHTEVASPHKPVTIDPLEPKRVPIKRSLYKLPANDLLTGPPKNNSDEQQRRTEQEQFAAILQEKLTRFGIQGTVSKIKSGPVITLIEYEPHIDSKISKIIALEDDLALALEAMSIRIIAPIPGRSVVGFEIANKKRQPVLLSEILQTSLFKQFQGHVPLALGKDTIGNPFVVDLVSMPHLLVAGSTGSGKSVGLNTMLISMLYRCKPEELRLVLIDPKRLEFASYADIPHLLFPIITDPQRAILALKWVVKTMEERYERMATCGVRNIFEYQQRVQQDQTLENMPLIVVMIDELSDLMMTAGKEVESYIARIAQMARAAGIHLVVATQRPSVDVITGLIKVNFPSRISFRVTSKADSRTILDASGADKLLGKGDMLFMDSGSGLLRVHGGYVSHKEVDQLVQYVRSQQQPEYLDLQQELPEVGTAGGDVDDGLYHEITSYIKTIDEVSISLLQRRFRIGYNRSARIIEKLETQGLIMPSEGGKTRKVIRHT